MWMTVGARRFAITLDDNAAARAFAKLLPLTLDMAELNGNEKTVGLPNSAADKRAPTRNDPKWRSHALRLDTLVVFYLTFDSAYSYTVSVAWTTPRALRRRSVRAAYGSSFPRTSYAMHQSLD